ncbi:hypothetical protein D3C80_121270 [compost metagenome]
MGLSVNELSRLNREATCFAIPLTSDSRVLILEHLRQHGAVVVGSTLLAIDKNSFFATVTNKDGSFVVGASDHICAAANNADDDGIAHAILWAEGEPICDWAE